MKDKRFNVRVYGIIVNNKNQILIADEERFGRRFTKFPGGGLEFGEGTIECIKRECLEELNQHVEVISHYYTTDFFQQSAFGNNEQLISIYYNLKLVDEDALIVGVNKFDFKEISDELISFRWLHLHSISANEFTFAVDKKVAELLKNEFKTS